MLEIEYVPAVLPPTPKEQQPHDDVGDDLEFRDTVLRARQLAPLQMTPELATRVRGPVEVTLGRIERGPDPLRGSIAANMLGLLLYTDPEDPNERSRSPATQTHSWAPTLAAGPTDGDQEGSVANRVGCTARVEQLQPPLRDRITKTPA